MLTQGKICLVECSGIKQECHHHPGGLEGGGWVAIYINIYINIQGPPVCIFDMA